MTIESAVPVAAMWVAKKIEPFITDKIQKFADKALAAKVHVEAVTGYVERLKKQHSTFISFVFPNEQRRLDDFYIPLTLRYVSSAQISAVGQQLSHRARCRISGFPSDLLETNNRILIVDTAGMGKSTVMKYLLLRQIEQESKVPIFVELRKITEQQTLLQFIFEQIYPNATSLTPDVFNKWIVNNCAFFFDGFDEVADSKKSEVARQIVELVETSTDSQFVLSSRDEPSLSALSTFSRYDINRLTLEEAEALIRKLVQNSIADTLVSKIRESQETIDHFLSNPLLVSLLVRAFLHTQILPRHLTGFYRQVYDALYQNHDASKDLGGYARTKKSELNLDNMHKVLRALAICGYLKGALEYSRDALIKEVSGAKKIALTGNFSESDFIDDVTRAVPLFLDETTTLRWTHRSLQEYFAAAYICMDANTKQPDLLRKLSAPETGGIHLNLLELVKDMDENAFRQYVVLPKIEELLNSADCQWPEFPAIPEKLKAVRRSIICPPACLIRLKEPVKRIHILANPLITNAIGQYFGTGGFNYELFDDHLKMVPSDNEFGTFVCAMKHDLSILSLQTLVDISATRSSRNTPGPISPESQAALASLEPDKLYGLDHTEAAALNSPELFSLGNDVAERMTYFIPLDDVKKLRANLVAEQEAAAQLISTLLT